MSTLVASNLIGPSNTGTAATLASINSGPIAGNRNRIINGAMGIDQRNGGASHTITAGAALGYTVDRWYAYCTGANVSGTQITSSGERYYRFTGAASVTSIGFGQRIEQRNSADLAGTTVTLGVDLSNSLLTSVNWTAYYANATDSFGTLAAPTRTQISTGSFTVNSTITRYSANISIPINAINGIEIVFTVGAQTSGTWSIGDVQLESGTVATLFERRHYGQELALCQRYYLSATTCSTLNVLGVTTNLSYVGNFPVTMRANPTIAGVAASFTTTNNFTSFANTAGGSWAGNAAFTASIEL